MSLASMGRTAEAIPALREAIALGVDDAEVSNALAGIAGRSPDSCATRARSLEAALATHRDDINLAHNLARLLATDPQFAPPMRRGRCGWRTRS